MPTIALIGPGAIGGTLAAWLATNPENEVSICARTGFKTLTVDHPGGILTSSPVVFTDPAQVKPVDWIIITTKAYQVEDAARWIKPFSHDSTTIAIAQNGVEHVANLSPFVVRDRMVPVIIDCPAERNQPGKILQRAPVLMTVPNDEQSARFKELFPIDGFTITLSDDWTTAAWKKLCINSGGAVSALLNKPANIVQEANAADVMRSLIRECIAVGRAEGAKIEDSIIEEVVAGQAAAPDGAMNSIHGDLVAKRPMEWDARNGVIARLGKKHGISTPCNEMAAAILATIEKTTQSTKG